MLEMYKFGTNSVTGHDQIETNDRKYKKKVSKEIIITNNYLGFQISN